MPGFTTIFLAALVTLVALIVGVFVLPPPWSWAIGIAYIAYDTWLLAYQLQRSRAAALGEPAGPGAVGRRPSLTVVIAARNERSALPATLAALQAGTLPPDIVVVDDGSDDGMAEDLAERFGLVWSGPLASGQQTPWLRVLRQAHAGKAVALNGALRVITNDLVVTIDADTVVEPGALAAVADAFAADAGLQAACGVLTPYSAGGPLADVFGFFQRREYARAFLWRAGWSADRCLVLVSGAFAIYRCDALRAVGGFDPASLVEDYDVMFRLHARQPGLRARVLRAARATTDAPASPAAFLRQRRRWFAGFIGTMWRHRALVGDPAQGALGRWHLRLKTIDTLLPLYGLIAGILLVVIAVRDGGLDRIVLLIVVAKVLIDAGLHGWAETTYRRWLGLPTGRAALLAPVLASVAEQIAFQPLRQLGALLGWFRLFGRGRGWATRRVVGVSRKPGTGQS